MIRAVDTASSPVVMVAVRATVMEVEEAEEDTVLAVAADTEEVAAEVAVMEAAVAADMEAAEVDEVSLGPWAYCIFGGFLSPPVLMHSGLLCVAFRLSVCDYTKGH